MSLWPPREECFRSNPPAAGPAPPQPVPNRDLLLQDTIQGQNHGNSGYIQGGQAYLTGPSQMEERKFRTMPGRYTVNG